MKFVLVNIDKNTKQHFKTLGKLYAHIDSNLGETNLSESKTTAFLLHHGTHHFKTAVCSYRIDLVMEPTDRFAFFIDGADGVGKTHAIENLDFGVDLEFGHLCEFGSDPLCPGVEQTAKQITLKCMADHENQMRDVMLAFADRYKNMRYYNDPSYKLFVVDRSWLTTAVYQGGDNVEVKATVQVMGYEFTNRLINMGILPVILLLRNPPYVNKCDDALDRNGKEVDESYRHSSVIANSDGCFVLQTTSNDVDYIIKLILKQHTNLLDAPKVEQKSESLLDRITKWLVK